MPVATLFPDEVHVWFADPDAANDPLLARYADLLDDGERARWQRFRFERDRRQFLVSHALVRTTLSRYADVPPERWAFERNAYGRPDAVLSLGCPPLRCNMSNTKGQVVCAIALDRELGVDVEARDPSVSPLALAGRYFAPSEAQALAELPVDAQPARFLHYWTLKEAYMKARGVGISLGLGNFSFDAGDREGPRVAFTDAIDDTPSDWWFGLLEPTPNHQAAVALRWGPVPGRPRLTAWTALPLSSERPRPVSAP